MLSGDRNQAIRSLCRGCLLGCLCLLPLAVAAQASPVGAPGMSDGAVPTPATPEDQIADRWLEAVRAQRQAWEERRRASQEAMDARRRQYDARSSTYPEARQQEHLRRREALMEHIERDREHFLNQGPWQPPPLPTPPTTPVAPEPPASGTPGSAPGSESRLAYPPLPGWNNRWYYQGY